MISHKTKQDVVYVIIALLIIGGCYSVFKIIELYRTPTEYIIARNGRITNYEQDVAYVVREESLINTSKIEGERHILVLDNNRAAKGDVVASFTQGENEEIKKEINELDVQIQELMEGVQVETSQDIKSLEKNLESMIYTIISDKNDIYNLNNKKKAIDELLEKKVKLVANESSRGSELNKLVDQRIKLEKEYSKNQVNITTDTAGLVSYRVDGYENILKPDNFSSITVDMLRKIRFSTNQLIPVSSNEIKIINNFYSYIIVCSNSEECKKLNLNDVVKYTVNNNFNDLSRATVDYIINDGDYRYIFLRTTDNIEKLAQYRKISVNLVWWNYQGIKVPENAILREEVKDELGNTITDIDYVNVQGTTGYTKKIWVKVESKAGGYAIIENYKDNELTELGIPQDLVNDRSNLNLYDKVLLGA